MKNLKEMFKEIDKAQDEFNKKLLDAFGKPNATEIIDSAKEEFDVTVKEIRNRFSNMK